MTKYVQYNIKTTYSFETVRRNMKNRGRLVAILYLLSQMLPLLMLTAYIFIAVESCCYCTWFVVIIEMMANLDSPVLRSMITPDDFVVHPALVVHVLS